MRRLLSWLGLATLMALVAAGVTLVVLLERGVSARAKPWAVEAWAARGLRHLAIPRPERERSNPVPRTEKPIAGGRAHFADHCAVCHGNDGSGDTSFGRGLYPPPPDMRGPDRFAWYGKELGTGVNHPANIVGAYDFAAELFAIDREELVAIAAENWQRFFGS